MEQLPQCPHMHIAEMPSQGGFQVGVCRWLHLHARIALRGVLWAAWWWWQARMAWILCHGSAVKSIFSTVPLIASSLSAAQASSPFIEAEHHQPLPQALEPLASSRSPAHTFEKVGGQTHVGRGGVGGSRSR